jgi:hypothetical protein
MIGHLGFSYIGFIFVLMLTIPNVIWIWNKPKEYDPTIENKLLILLERTGQILCTTTVLFFNDFNLKVFEVWILWFFVSIALMVLYEIYWIRYFRSNKTLHDFYRSFFFIPLPGATLPVVAFFLLGIYEKVIWIIISSIILGVGHIGIHLEHLKRLK